ncbi:unnamed protein product [Vicia faba]|uniref:Pectinesterase inhibitor domain-containing protein n=1 Tax=Vicia faba TaxID=3906 RepID=A0AAV1ARR8_VICFA|nr:unnamed protein product [Vicia faba]
MSRLSILAIVFLFCIASSNAAVDIQAICQKAKNPTFCKNLLTLKAGGDLSSLAQYTLDVTPIQLLKSLDYNGVSVHLSAVMTDVDECISDESPPDNSDLPKSAETVYQVSQISLIISNLLVQK